MRGRKTSGCNSRILAMMVWLAASSPLHLFQGEEYVHFRLYKQLAADLPVGPLGQYAYGDARGLTGGGSVVLSGLYLAVAPIFGRTTQFGCTNVAPRAVDRAPKPP